MDEESLEEALAVLEALAPFEPSVADAVDALEEVLGGTDAIRTALERAERAGLIERAGGRIRVPTTHREPVDRGGAIVTREGDFRCVRCGRSVSTGYFLRVDGKEVGPYGSTCIRKVTGQD